MRAYLTDTTAIESSSHAASIQGLRKGEALFYSHQDLLPPLTNHIPSGNSAREHASVLNRAAGSRPSFAGNSVLQLQRQYGNRYVQRVLALARQGNDEAEVTPEVESTIERARGGGRELDHGVRQEMESAFGNDFGGVRVHTGGESHSLNKSVNAVAFTTGRDIFFSDGAYSPGSNEGKELLAHELTHVVQQGGSVPISGKAQRFQIQRMCPACEEEKKKTIQHKLTVGQQDDQYEQEAERTAKSVVGRLSLRRADDVHEHEMSLVSEVGTDLPATQQSIAGHPVQRMCPSCAEEHQEGPGNSVRTALINTKGFANTRVEVRNVSTGLLSRQGGNPWFECKGMGVPCPPASFFNGQVCRMVGCSRAATANLPFAVSPGICIFRCDDGSVCTCVLVGSSTSAICTFKFCDSAGQANTQEDFDNLAVAAVNAYNQQGPDQGQGQGQGPSSSDGQSEESPVATA